MKRYAAVRQWLDIICVLPHLDRTTEKYARAHLAYAGDPQDIFTERAMDDIYEESTRNQQQLATKRLLG